MELKRNGNYWNVKLSKICEWNWGKFLSSFGVWLFDKSKWRLVSRSLRRKNRCSHSASRLLVQGLWKCLLNAACTAQCRRGVLHKRNFITFYRHFCFRGLNWKAVTSIWSSIVYCLKQNTYFSKPATSFTFVEIFY